MPPAPKRDEERHIPLSQAKAAMHLQYVVKHAPIVLWALDKDGIFTLSEGAGLTALGLEPGQVVGASAFDIYVDAPGVIEHLRRGLAGEEFAGKLGVADRMYHTHYSPLTDSNGDSNGLLGVSMDITERHVAEMERRVIQQQLLQAQKLESVGLLASGIAHDFNNILTGILGGAETALLQLEDDHPARRQMDRIVLASLRAAELVRQMLAYSGKGSVEVTSINISSLIRDVTTLLETTIPKKVQLSLELASDLPTILADVGQVQQVLMNLVINGAEAIGDGTGAVIVRTGSEEVTDTFTTGFVTTDAISPGHYVYIEVSDDGCGMDEATIDKIFDPFFSTKFSGRGLGLAPVLGIIRAQRGAIRVQSAPDEGTTFRVLFPASDTTPLAQEPTFAHYRGDGTVLVIDDDEGVRIVAREILEHFGFKVIDVENGQLGIDSVATHGDDIRVAVLDMTMPLLSGEETLRELRALSPELPVILISGYHDRDVVDRVTTESRTLFVQKPFAASELGRALEQLLPEQTTA